MDRLGTSVIPVRLSGSVDYKRARFFFYPNFSLRQALFVDSKAEKASGAKTATIQTSQTSMSIRFIRSGAEVSEQGSLPQVYAHASGTFLTTTIFVKYNYTEAPGPVYQLTYITVSCVPNGMLAALYNPSPSDTFWRPGRDAPTLGEAFRVRIDFPALKGKSRWRVQRIDLSPESSLSWDE